MKRAPKIGDRVRYQSALFPTERVASGTVVKLYQKHDDVFDDDGEFIRRGPLLPPDKWKATVKVDQIPKWWPYPNTDRFCPDVAELEPLP